MEVMSWWCPNVRSKRGSATERSRRSLTAPPASSVPPNTAALSWGEAGGAERAANKPGSSAAPAARWRRGRGAGGGIGEAAESPAASPGALCGADRKQRRKPWFRSAAGTQLGLGPTGTVWGGWWRWDPMRGSGGP